MHAGIVSTSDLPDEKVLSEARLDPESLTTADLKAATRTVGADLPLVGRLVWSEQELGWKADWRLAPKGRIVAWRITGVNFDDAFRNAMRGAAQILSGNGEPG